MRGVSTPPGSFGGTVGASLRGEGRLKALSFVLYGIWKPKLELLT